MSPASTPPGEVNDLSSSSSVAYYIFHRTPSGYAEIGTNAEGDLFIRHTLRGKVQAVVPLGPCTEENVKRLSDQLRTLAITFPKAA